MSLNFFVKANNCKIEMIQCFNLHIFRRLNATYCYVQDVLGYSEINLHVSGTVHDLGQLL